MVFVTDFLSIATILSPHQTKTPSTTMDSESSMPPSIDAEKVQDKEQDVQFELTGAKLFLVVFGLVLAIFLMSLDASILATAVPHITAQFGSVQDIGWYGSAYTFATCSVQPISGKLFTYFSLKV